MNVLPDLATVLRDAALPAGSHLSRVVDAEAGRMRGVASTDPFPVRPTTGAFERALRHAKERDGGAIIAEFKRASPSLGPFAADRDIDGQLTAYHAGGAACVSVLAEPALFRGSVADVQRAAAHGMPRLYKGFVLCAAHLDEAGASGADAVLLIARVLRGHTAAFAGAARARGLEPLVELHDTSEIGFARDAGAGIVGINARDLASFTLGSPDAAPLREAFPTAVLVRESGLKTPGDVRGAFAQGFDAVLIGETLMRNDDPAAFLRACRA